MPEDPVFGVAEIGGVAVLGVVRGVRRLGQGGASA
jgi:hypothetical protein